MAVDFMLLLKIKLLATGGGGGSDGGGHCHLQLHSALFSFFLMKLPLAFRMRGFSYTDVAFSLRLFFFRLSRVLFPDAPAHGGQRWERALRLFRERVADDGRLSGAQRSDEVRLHVISMMAL